MRLAPTTLIGVSGSRSSPVSAAHSFGTFSGNFFIAVKVPSNIAHGLVAGLAERADRAVRPRWPSTGVMPSMTDPLQVGRR